MRHSQTVEGIQYLRGIAAAFVVITHSSAIMAHPEYFGAAPLPLQNTGVFGVAVFFVISGFIISIVSLAPDGSAKLSISTFLSRRFRRIIPFMWVCVIGYNIFTLLGTGMVEWGPAIRAFFLWPIGEPKPNVVWTLRHEMIFYGLFALCLLSARRLPWLLAAWFVAPLVVSTLAVGFPAAFAGLPPALQDLINVLLVGRGANLQFGCGLALGMMWMRGHKWMQHVLPGGAVTLLVIAAAGAALYEVLTPIMMFNPNNMVPVAQTGPVEILFITAMASLVVWCGAVATAGSGVIARMGRVLGDASFSIYLIHSVPILVLLELSNRVPFGLPPVLFCVAISLVAIVAGVVLHYLVELPLLRILTQRRSLEPARGA